MNNLTIFLAPIFLFLVTIGFGFWVKRTGKPYNGLLFNFHKLIALAGVLLAGFRIYKMGSFSSLPIQLLISIGITAFCVVAMFATGAMMSIKKR